MGADEFKKILQVIKNQLNKESNFNAEFIEELEKLDLKISPAKILVIIALLTNAMDVTSVLVDNRQMVRVLISGSLSRKKPKPYQPPKRKPAPEEDDAESMTLEDILQVLGRDL